MKVTRSHPPSGQGAQGASGRTHGANRLRPGARRTAEADLSYEFPPTPVPTGRPIYMAAMLLATLWAAGLGWYTAPLRKDGLVLAVLVLLAVGPAALVLAVAYLIRQGDKLAAELSWSAGPDEALLGPALRAAAGADAAAGAVRREITAATQAANRARDDMVALRQALSEEHAAIRATGELAPRMNADHRDLTALSQALDAQLADAAKIIDLQARKVAKAARAAEAKFDSADQSLKARAEALGAAAAAAAAAAQSAGAAAAGDAERLLAAAARAPAAAAAMRELPSQQPAGATALLLALRAEREKFINAAAAQTVKLQALADKICDAAKELRVRARDAGEALRGLPGAAALPERTNVVQPFAPAPAPASPSPASAGPELEDLPTKPAPAATPAAAASKRPAPVKVRPKPVPAAAAHPLVTARGVGGRVAFDGFRILIDRTQSASFVLHGSGGQRSIQLAEIVKIRLVPPRRGAHGYLQFVLSRERAGQGGPADVNSILFEPAEQPQFQALAEAMRRDARHLRRRPPVSDPRAPGEMAHLMDLRGRGLIDAQEFAEASARLESAKRRPPRLLPRRKPRA